MKFKQLLIDNDINSYSYRPYGESESRGERVDKNTNNIAYIYSALKEADVPNFLVLVEDVLANKTHIGDVTLLETDAKDNLVNAINEVNHNLIATDSSAITDDSATNPTLGINPHLSQINTNKTDIATNVTNIDKNYNDIGDITTLTTTTKTSTVGAINELKGYTDTNASDIATNKTNIATNVTNIATNTTNITSNDVDIANVNTKVDTLAAAIVDTFDVRGNYNSSGGAMTAATEFIPTLTETTAISSAYMTFTAPNKFTAVQNGNFEALIFGSCKIVGATKNVECRLYKNGALVETNKMTADADSSVSLGFSMHTSKLVPTDVVDIRFYYAESGTISGLGVTYNIGYATVTAEGVTSSSKLANDSTTNPTLGINPQLVKADANALQVATNKTDIATNKTDIAAHKANFSIDPSNTLAKQFVVKEQPTANGIVGLFSADQKNSISWTKDTILYNYNGTSYSTQWGNHADNIGDMGSLEGSGTNLVEAINAHHHKIGDLTTLKTDAKGDLVSAINEVFDGGGGSGGSGEYSLVSYTTIPSLKFKTTTMDELFKMEILGDGDAEIHNLSIEPHKMTVLLNYNETTDEYRPIGYWQPKLDTLETNIDTNKTNIGNMGYLTTSNKADLVHAINEVNGNTGEGSIVWDDPQGHLIHQLTLKGASASFTEMSLMLSYEDGQQWYVFWKPHTMSIWRYFQDGTHEIYTFHDTAYYKKEFAQRDAKIIKLNQQMDQLDLANYDLIQKQKAQDTKIKALQATVNKFDKFMKILQGIA